MEELREMMRKGCKMTDSELYARFLALCQRYKDALAEHNLGAAAIARDEAAKLLCQEWERILAALERIALPLSAGSVPSAEAPAAPHEVASRYDVMRDVGGTC